ncbi:unnamed protein product [Gulo gulo]|uniref:Uncharacterized protein n=1 Tax=Gulo gulo TaxID=48420 RepID=A0A9X9LCF5_GULGU|nr:unnamed protein product [Gulo gulo]
MTLGFHVPTSLPRAWPVGVPRRELKLPDCTFQMFLKLPILSTPPCNCLLLQVSTSSLPYLAPSVTLIKGTYDLVTFSALPKTPS